MFWKQTAHKTNRLLWRLRETWEGFYNKNPDSLFKLFLPLYPMLWLTFIPLIESRAHLHLLDIWCVIFFMHFLRGTIRHLCFEGFSIKHRHGANCIRKSLCHLPYLAVSTVTWKQVSWADREHCLNGIAQVKCHVKHRGLFWKKN